MPPPDMNEETARLLGQARGYEFAGRPDEAKECFREILRRHPGNVSLLFQGGVVYLKARDYREAERCFDEILKTVPDHHGALLNKAACCIFTGRGAGAVGYYEQVIGLVPTAMDPRINLIRLLLQLQWHDEAIRQCDAALGMDPGNMIVAGLRQACGAGGSPVSPAPPPTPPWNPGPAMLRAAILQGRQLALAGKKAEAVRWFDDLIARLPQQSADLWVERGIAVNMSQHAGPVSLSRTDDIYEAIRCFEKAIAINPRCRSAMISLGMLYSDNLDFTEAHAWLDRALAVDPHSIGALVGKAMTYAEAARFAEAIECCDRCLRLSGTPSTIRQLRNKYVAELEKNGPQQPLPGICFRTAFPRSSPGPDSPAGPGPGH